MSGDQRTVSVEPVSASSSVTPPTESSASSKLRKRTTTTTTATNTQTTTVTDVAPSSKAEPQDARAGDPAPTTSDEPGGADNETDGAFPSTPLRFFCEGYANSEKKQQSFVEGQRRRRKEALAWAKQRVAEPAAELRSGHSTPRAISPPTTFGGPPTIWEAIGHCLLLVVFLCVVYYCYSLLCQMGVRLKGS